MLMADMVEVETMMDNGSRYMKRLPPVVVVTAVGAGG